MYLAFSDDMFSQHHPLQCNKKGPSDTEAENVQFLSQMAFRQYSVRECD